MTAIQDAEDHKDWAAKPKTYNLIETSEITGLSRSTLERALREGCPAIERADRDQRKEWRLCIADIIAFRILQKRKEAYAKECRRQGLPIDPSGLPPMDRFVEESIDDMILQLRDFLAVVGPEPSAKRRAAMISNLLAVLDRFDLLRGKEL